MKARLVLSGFLAFAVIVALGACPGTAHAVDALAVPTGGAVVSGSAAISSPSAGILHIDQSSDRAVIDWQSFNIGSAATAQFFQPSASSLAVNRVTGGGVDPTQILGTLRSNGRVMVLDPNGVMFGAGSRVDVGGLIASTGNVDAAAVMGGGGFTISSIDTGSIVNDGLITAANGGFVALVAPQVVNNGVITARLGQVSLASGKAVTVDFMGDRLISFAAGSALGGAKVTHTGNIDADGGLVRMDVSGAQSVLDTVINTTGIVSAGTIGTKDGRIVLNAGTRGRAEVSGTLAASGGLEIGGEEARVAGDLIAGAGGVRLTSRGADLYGRIYGAGGALLGRADLGGTTTMVRVMSNAASIQQGVDLSTQTVHIVRGTYDENVDVHKNGMSLRGETGGAQALLRGVTGGGAVVNVTANNVRLYNLAISSAIAGGGQSVYGVNIDGRSGVKVDRDSFTGFAASGAAAVRINGGTVNTVTQSVFDHVGRGVLVTGGSGHVLISNSFDHATTGLYVSGTSSAQLWGNGFIGGTTGMILRNAANMDVRQNTWTELDSRSLGIDASGLSGTSQMRFNEFAGTGYRAVTVSDSDNLLIRRNTFSGARDAVSVSDSENVSVLSNIFATRPEDIGALGSGRVEGTGFRGDNTDGLVFSGNWMDDAYYSGVYLTQSRDVSIDNNLIVGNTVGLWTEGYGMGLVTLTDTTFEDNFIGAWVRGGGVSLAGGNMFDGGSYGLKLEGAYVWLAGNTLGDTVFTGQSLYHVALKNGALYDSRARTPVIVDADSASFNGILAGTASNKQATQIEEKLLDYDDTESVGQILVRKKGGKKDHDD